MCGSNDYLFIFSLIYGAWWKDLELLDELFNYFVIFQLYENSYTELVLQITNFILLFSETL